MSPLKSTIGTLCRLRHHRPSFLATSRSCDAACARGGRDKSGSTCGGASASRSRYSQRAHWKLPSPYTGAKWGGARKRVKRRGPRALARQQWLKLNTCSLRGTRGNRMSFVGVTIRWRRVWPQCVFYNRSALPRHRRGRLRANNSARRVLSAARHRRGRSFSRRVVQAPPLECVVTVMDGFDMCRRFRAPLFISRCSGFDKHVIF